MVIWEEEKKTMGRILEIIKGDKMLNTLYRNSFSEIIDILKHMKKEDVQKISPEFLEYLRKNASKTYIPNLDHSKTIKEMELSPRTKAILALIYKKYWSNMEVNKIPKDINLNDVNIDVHVENNTVAEQIVATEAKDETKTELMLHEESFFEKILNKIKSIFRRAKSSI